MRYETIYYRQFIKCFLMDLQAYTQDRLLIVNGADLEYTNKNTK